MTAIDSTALSEIEYDEDAHTLFVRFVSGAWYAYLAVPPELHERIRRAPSKGRFFQEEVRDRFDVVRLDLSPG